MEFNDFALRRLALAISIIGFCLIFFWPNQAKEIMVNEINEEMIGQKIKTKGTIDWFKEIKGGLLFGLRNEEKINVVRFSPAAEEREIVKAKKAVEVVGEIKKFRGELEIVAEKITGLN